MKSSVDALTPVTPIASNSPNPLVLRLAFSTFNYLTNDQALGEMNGSYDTEASSSPIRNGDDLALEIPLPRKKIRNICCLGAGYVVSQAAVSEVT